MIQPTDKASLAKLYFPDLMPHAATDRLRRWMCRSTDLMRALRTTGYRPHQRLLTPGQVALIYRYLGEP